MNGVNKEGVLDVKRTTWFHQAGFGMVIHWGLYSVLGRGEWVMYMERIPKEEYAKLAEQFIPAAQFKTNDWIALAQEAGMRYAVLTTRHHDGFCLFDSKISDFTSVKAAVGRDFVAEYVAACRKAGMKVGLYYSLLDWRFPGYHHREKFSESFQEMVTQVHSQVKELMTNYGKIDLLWYDGGWLPGIEINDRVTIANYWRAKELNEMVRKLQPQILINNRSGIDGDIDTPEQQVVPSQEGRLWESCMTMGDFCTWGYVKNNPNFKSTTQLIQYLVNIAAYAGNYLLNIGPKPDGSVRNEEVQRLKEIGAWMMANGEAIYGSERVPVGFGGPNFIGSGGWGGPWGAGMLGAITAKGRTVYLHIFRWPGKSITISGVKNKVLSARILTTGDMVKIEQTNNGRLFVKGLPEEPLDKHDTVIVLELDGKPKVFSYEGIP